MNDMTAATQAIAAKSREFETHYNAGDAAALVDAYFVAEGDDPYASPPGGQPPVRGREALKGMFAAMIPDTPKIRLETLDVVAAGDLAYELGLAHLTLGDGAEVKGRYTACWIQRDGEWRVKIDFFAADGWAS